MRKALPAAAVAVWLAVIVLARSGASAPAHFLEPVTTVLASLVQSLVGLVGVEALRAGAFLYVPGVFAYEIGIGCSGLVPAVVLAAAIVASPGTRAAKRRGLVVGVLLVLAVNLVRLAHLFYVGLHAPWAFALAHAVLWEGAILLVACATWLVWSRWSAGLVGEAAQ